MDPHVDDGQLNALLDGELDTSGREAVETHLASCAQCRARYEDARRFLSQASDLLGYLDAPEVRPAAKPVAAPPAPDVRRVAATAQEPAVILPGPGVAKTAREPAVDPAAAVARTAKEKAVEVEPPAGPPDLPSTAVRPMFGQTMRGGEGEVPPRRPWGVPPLAWAAMLVVGMGAWWLVTDAVRPPQPAMELASGPAPLDTTTTSAAEPTAGSHTATTATPPSRTAARRPLVKPQPMRGGKAPTADQAADRIPRDRPAGASKRSDELAAAPAAANAGAGVRSTQPPAGAAAAGAVGAVAAPAPATVGAAAEASRAPAPTRAATVTPPASAFQRITLEDAVRRLSGSIRLIDGFQPGVVEVGPGRLVPGAAPDREVVRVHYQDEAGQPLVLDQQPGDSASALSVNGLMRGDTLVTGQPDGTTRVRWVDRKSFWLSLTGAGGPDTLRMLVERIR